MRPARLAAAFLFGAGAVGAQATGVVSDPAGRPISGAEVSVPSRKRSVLTDSAGRYYLGGVARGAYSIRVRHIGYEAVSMRAQIYDDAPEISVVLKPFVVMLDTVVATANCAWKTFDGFACRRRAGRGIFLDDVAIDSAHVERPIELFYDMPGLRLIRGQRGLQPAATTGWKCVTTIVNGVKPSQINHIPFTADSLLGVEYYEKPADVPRIYEQYSWNGRYRCGLINYWTVRP